MQQWGENRHVTCLQSVPLLPFFQVLFPCGPVQTGTKAPERERSGACDARSQISRASMKLAQGVSLLAAVFFKYDQRDGGLVVQPHPAKVLETRKTVPGLRLLDKWAVLVGGGGLHRVGLFDMAMIKNNHIAAAGGLRPALQSCRVCSPCRPTCLLPSCTLFVRVNSMCVRSSMPMRRYESTTFRTTI